VLLLLPVDCHVAATMSMYFISSHTSLPAGVHIDPQRDPVSGRSLRSQANLVVAGITRCNCPFWFIATDPNCVLTRAHYNRKCRWSIYLFTLGLALTSTLPALIIQLKQFLWTDTSEWGMFKGLRGASYLKALAAFTYLLFKSPHDSCLFSVALHV
jgi:hypothetical protein